MWKAVACAVLTVGASCQSLAFTQPNGQQVPIPLTCDGDRPVGLMAVFACQCVDLDICNIGAWCPGPPACDQGINSNCETTLWHLPNDNACIPSQSSGLNAYADGYLDPQTYLPAGTVTFELLSRGTSNFSSVFCWYNVTGQTPDPADLHEVYDCNDGAGTQLAIDLLNEPAYLGGVIGFAVVSPESHSSPGACASWNCCASPLRLVVGEGYAYYTERQFNPDYVGDSSWLHVIAYRSRLDAQRVIFAAEDLLGAGPGSFTSMVVSVSGIVGVATGVEVGPTVSEFEPRLLPNTPNPFNPLTTIVYELPTGGAVELVIYDTMGQQVRRMGDSGTQTAGRHETVWDGRSDDGLAMPSGVYFCRLQTAGSAQTIKLAILK